MRSMMSCLMLCGQRLVAGDAVDHGGDFALAEPVEGECSDVRPSDPRRLELRSVRDDQQHAKSSYPVHRPTERFKARRVDPMRILEDHQHRIGSRQRLQLRGERFQRLLPPLLRGQFERRDSVHRSAATAFRQTVPRPDGGVKLCASSASSLSSFACAVSSCANPAARSIWLMIG